MTLNADSSAENISSIRPSAWVPGIACLLAVLQLLRNTLTPAASGILSFDGDVALHVLLGNLMLERGWWLDGEPTNALMAGHPFIAHEWLSELMLALSWRAFGFAGPVLVTALILAWLSAAMFHRAQRSGAGAWSAVLALVVAFTVMNGHLHPRPHVWTWALAFAFIGLLDQLRAGALTTWGWWWRSASLILLWAQVHAGFLVAFLLVALEGAGSLMLAASAEAPGSHLRRFRDLAVGGVGLLLVSAINPWGFSLHAHFLTWMANPYLMSFTTEFMSPDFKSTGGRFLAAWLACLALALVADRRSLHPGDLLRALALSFLALSSARHGAMLAALTAPWVASRWQILVEASWSGPAGGLSRAWRASDARLAEAERTHGGAGTFALVLVAVTAATGIVHRPAIGFLPELQPVAATAWIEEHPDELVGQMFNPFRWGAYLAFELYPDRLTFVNSWHDHLGEEVIRTYLRAHDARPRWQQVLDDNHIGWVIYETGSVLAVALSREPGWRRVYRDSTAVIFVREPG